CIAQVSLSEEPGVVTAQPCATSAPPGEKNHVPEWPCVSESPARLGARLPCGSGGQGRGWPGPAGVGRPRDRLRGQGSAGGSGGPGAAGDRGRHLRHGGAVGDGAGAPGRGTCPAVALGNRPPAVIIIENDS